MSLGANSLTNGLRNSSLLVAGAVAPRILGVEQGGNGPGGGAEDVNDLGVLGVGCGQRKIVGREATSVGLGEGFRALENEHEGGGDCGLGGTMERRAASGSGVREDLAPARIEQRHVENGREQSDRGGITAVTQTECVV